MKVAIREGDECWEWQGARNKTGYGAAWDGERVVPAHRLAWRLVMGEYPSDDVLHRCDNPPCVRPNHLWLGTHADNMADMVVKGRSANKPRPSIQGDRHYIRERGVSMQGESNPYSKLTIDGVRFIRQQHRLGRTSPDIARDLGVHSSTVHKIVAGVNWKGIE